MRMFMHAGDERYIYICGRYGQYTHAPELHVQHRIHNMEWILENVQRLTFLDHWHCTVFHPNIIHSYVARTTHMSITSIHVHVCVYAMYVMFCVRYDTAIPWHETMLWAPM